MLTSPHPTMDTLPISSAPRPQFNAPLWAVGLRFKAFISVRGIERSVHLRTFTCSECLSVRLTDRNVCFGLGKLVTWVVKEETERRYLKRIRTGIPNYRLLTAVSRWILPKRTKDTSDMQNMSIH